MRTLLGSSEGGTHRPASEDVDPVELYLAAERPLPAERPWVALSMITSLDGATATDGRSGGLASPADKEVFMAVRAMADVILVAAGTVRAEGYGPVKLRDARIQARAAAGRTRRLPRLAIVTGSLDLDLTSDLFSATDAESRPLVLTTEDADPARRSALAEVAEVRAHGTGSVDLRAALVDLRTRGDADIVVCEGGPTLNSGLADVGCIDEICLSLSPLLAGGESSRLASGPSQFGTRFTLASLLEEDSMLLGRWVRDA
jgi:riboflavin biosynthesis pyrimidine reductase